VDIRQSVTRVTGATPDQRLPSRLQSTITDPLPVLVNITKGRRLSWLMTSYIKTVYTRERYPNQYSPGSTQSYAKPPRFIRDRLFIMAALRSRCGYYILPCGFFLLSSSFFIPRLSQRS